jgi:RNA polymerase sigma-70 factor (ECF subfamily)
VAPLSESALADLYRKNARPLWAYVYRITSNAADADDIVQEAFIRVFDADVGGFAAEDLRKYLFRTASNLTVDRWRRSAREERHLDEVGRHTASIPAPQHDKDVIRMFAQLQPRDRALLWLAYVEGEDRKSIAQSLQVARGSVKVLLSRRVPGCATCCARVGSRRGEHDHAVVQRGCNGRG